MVKKEKYLKNVPEIPNGCFRLQGKEFTFFIWTHEIMRSWMAELLWKETQPHHHPDWPQMQTRTLQPLWTKACYHSYRPIDTETPAIPFADSYKSECCLLPQAHYSGIGPAWPTVSEWASHWHRAALQQGPLASTPLWFSASVWGYRERQWLIFSVHAHGVSASRQAGEASLVPVTLILSVCKHRDSDNHCAWGRTEHQWHGFSVHRRSAWTLGAHEQGLLSSVHMCMGMLILGTCEKPHPAQVTLIPTARTRWL